MNTTFTFFVSFIAWLVVVLLIARAMRINGRDESAEAAADSIRQQLERDDELLTYTRRPHVKAFTEPRT